MSSDLKRQPPKHHPSDDTLLRHAAGHLACGHALAVATHLPFCPMCQDAIRTDEAIGGALLAALPPTDLAPDTLTRMLARLEPPRIGRHRQEEEILLADGVPLPDALRSIARPNWRWVAPGVSRIVVDAPDAVEDERICLLRVAPGCRLPEHGHHGWEAACVLAGSFSDASGEYGPGDFAEKDVTGIDGDGLHQPIAGSNEACICLLAWEGPLRLRGIVARLLRPLLRL